MGLNKLGLWASQMNHRNFPQSEIVPLEIFISPEFKGVI